MPQVSIITALHNKGPYIAETVRSVLAQTLTDWEMIVVENGSTDNGVEIVGHFSDPRIRLVVSPKQGPGAARNFGLKQARGDWILFLDADDLIEPGYLKERMALAATHPAADLLVGAWEEFHDGQTDRLRRVPTALHQSAAVLAQSAIAFAPWALHAAMVRRARISPSLCWPEAMDGLPSEDTAFWFPLVYGAVIAWTERAGALYRVQTTSSRNEIRDPERWVRAIIEVIQHNVAYLAKRGGDPDVEQCANIVRVFESNYLMALKQGSRAAANLAKEHGERWLKTCPMASKSIVVRKMTGLRLFNLLRHGVI